ncbi:hypothetical protein FOA52_012163 [Chlamydomonas sp. UWO 241]|nr:hypothetical protein FOA52_012163 [Chlamydomonas sp. UWO 241]
MQPAAPSSLPPQLDPSGPQAAELSLPRAVLAHVFSTLRACDVAAAAAVCSEWRAAVDTDAVAWTRAVVELDPFGSLGGGDGAYKLFHAAGGSWLNAAAALAGCVETCAVCAAAGSARSAVDVLCRCCATPTAQESGAGAGGGVPVVEEEPGDDAVDGVPDEPSAFDHLGCIVTGQPHHQASIHKGGFVKR